MALAGTVYSSTAIFPREEMYGLTAQMRRCLVSIPSNIAEGYGRDSGGAFVQFLKVAQGSLKVLETQIILAQRLKFLSEEVGAPILSECDEIGKMLGALIRSIRNKQ